MNTSTQNIFKIIKDNTPYADPLDPNHMWALRSFRLLNAVEDGLSFLKCGSDNSTLSDILENSSFNRIEDFYMIGYNQSLIEENRLEFLPGFMRVKAYLENGLPGYDVNKLIKLRSSSRKESDFIAFRQQTCAYEKHAYFLSMLINPIIKIARGYVGEDYDKFALSLKVFERERNYPDGHLTNLLNFQYLN